MDDVVIRDFLNQFDESCYPCDFIASYEAIECLGHNEQGESLLVREKKTGAYYVAKCYDRKLDASSTMKGELLKDIKQEGLPGFIAEYQNEAMHCVIWEYIKGNSLAELALGKEFTYEQAISVVIKLCDILTYLHGHKPPIIHRDIKPQNIILDPEGKVHLIDFGISRLYHEELKNDTICYGTKGFAAPEQYGFAQTDCRADIFSLGVVLCWLLTGEEDIKLAVSKLQRREVRHIISKCTAFSPEKRYSSAQKVKKALLRLQRKSKAKLLVCLCSVLLCCSSLCAGFALGRYTEITPCFLTTSSVRFKEPLIEKAVRLSLNKPEGSRISEDDLLEVTEICIFGNRVTNNLQEFDAYGQQMGMADSGLYNGGIRSLKDVSRLKNLRSLSIALQNITDVTPLCELSKLEHIELKHNPIEDVSPLGKLPAMHELYLYDTRVSDLRTLSECPRLENLVVGRSDVTSVDAFTGLNGLVCLHAAEVTYITLSGIEKHTQLEEISFYRVEDGDLSPLLALPRLKKVYMSKTMKEAADRIADKARFDIIFQEK